MESWLEKTRLSQYTIGFVPTMGALHAGHIELVQASKSQNDITVASIFVNPSQFNDPADLAKYPRTLEADSQLLIKAGCDLLFYPSVEEIYPANLPLVELDLEGLDQVMEGVHRPGHFRGVVQVVHRLLSIVRPHRLYMGLKDFQQISIIEFMIHRLELGVRLVKCPTHREINGLAMSSRNQRLSSQGKALAGKIYRELRKAPDLASYLQPIEVKQMIFNNLDTPPFTPEYVDIVHRVSLKPLESWPSSGDSVICTAVFLEGVRLIDNLIF
jgi:pantoate--beta-alanine ligase